MTRRRILTVLLAAAVIPVVIGASVRDGIFPSFVAEDITGQPWETEAWLNDLNLVVVMTHRGADDQVRAWYEAADVRGFDDVHRQTLISLRLPFLIGIETARSRARENVPPDRWQHTLLDRDGEMAEILGLPVSRDVVVFVLDGDGRILAAAVGHPDEAETAHAVWNALE